MALCVLVFTSGGQGTAYRQALSGCWLSCKSDALHWSSFLPKAEGSSLGKVEEAWWGDREPEFVFCLLWPPRATLCTVVMLPLGTKARPSLEPWGVSALSSSWGPPALARWKGQPSG